MVELSDHDVETVTRRSSWLSVRTVWVTFNPRWTRTRGDRSSPDRRQGGPAQRGSINSGDDYPLLPVRRRFWEHVLRAVDRAGTAGQLRTQLRIVYDAIRHTANQPLGTVVPADFLFGQISANMLNSRGAAPGNSTRPSSVKRATARRTANSSPDSARWCS